MNKVKVPLIVYLAGGITGLTYDEAFGWRKEVTQKLEIQGIKCYNPLQADDLERYNDGSSKFTSGGKICYLRDKFMVQKSDIILINLLNSEKAMSWGTLVEKGWSDGEKLIILVTSDSITHPFITENCIIVSSLEEAIDLIMGLT